ncbi:hypothetical protein LCGC14_1049090 [marine sediment metagenome]|uniref:Uncharacterized protein n=1 Tax=marine sediment metagenome TaxID=412755 RepID=A0A0F9Q7E9_9ZZZZ
MFATIISRALFYYAFHAGAADPEDVAQDVIVNLLKRPHWVRSNMTSYLRVAARNQIYGQQRTESAPSSLNVDWLPAPDPPDDDAVDAVSRLTGEYPDLVAWLIDYSERASYGVTDRVRASRSRRKLREVLAT